MNNALMPSPTPSTVGVGIQGLPHLAADMISGGLYVLIAELPSARFPLLAGGLASALKTNKICNVIVSANPELFIRRVESFDCFSANELVAASQLNFFVMQEEFPKKMFRFGAESFVRELEQFEIAPNSYLLFDQADELLSLHDISLALEQIEVLRKWFDQRKVTALLVFSRSTAENSGTINALMDHLTGIARLSGDRDGLEITFDYWQSPEATITARNYPLVTLDSGLYEATTRVVSSKQIVEEEKYERRVEPEDSEPRYFYMDPGLDNLAEQLPGVWQRVETSIGMMHATRNTRYATCILSFDGDSNLQQLAETVHTLRVGLGRQAHIVVQEKEASLGHQSEALLLRLGVNLVVHRDVRTERLPVLLQSLNGQVFKRDIEVSFEAAVQSAFPTKQRSYVPAQTFAREVSAALDRTEVSGVPCAMVTGKPAHGLALIDLLTRNILTRPGDMMSSDGESCYIFLYACPQSEIVAVLEEILGVAVDSAFDDPKLFIQRVEIEPELAELLQVAKRIDSASAPTGARVLQTKASVSQAENRETPLFASMGTSKKNVESVNPVHVVGTAFKPAFVTQPSTSQDRASAAVQALRPSLPDAMLPPSRTATVAQAAGTGSLPDATVEGPLFNYDTASNTPTFGKKEAPRATRSASK